MSPPHIVPCGEATEEVSTLIATLHRTEQRLEELTGGEVDTVGDGTGRTLLLLRAQDQLRQSEATKQAAILNALPANIVLLNNEGEIVLANGAWRRFGDANALRSPAHAVGLNYLDICDSAEGDDASEGHEAAAGIRSVLDGQAKAFSIEYPCHSPSEKRWFRLIATPLSDDRSAGAVVMHLVVTGEREAQERLRASELRFRHLIENVSDLIIVAQADGVLMYVSPSMKQMGGYEPDEIMGRGLLDFIHPDDRMQGMKLMAEVRSSPGRPLSAELRFRHSNGSWQTLESMCTNLSHVPEIGGVLMTARNVTERKQAEINIKRLNRVHSMLSGINTLIVRATDRGELFRKACLIAVAEGGFRMAFIGLADRHSPVIVPVASAGVDDALLSGIRKMMSSPADAPKTLAARAIRDKMPVVANDSRSDTRLCLREAHNEHGVRSVALLPLMVMGEAIGVLALYANEPDFFHNDEMELLTELADDIAFAIDHLNQQDRLTYLAYYDVLTGLANRSLFLERVAQYTRSAAGGGHKLAVYIIDLERFRNINDSLGRQAGDLLLKQVAEWLTDKLKDAGLLARIDADHFAAVLPIVWRDTDVAVFLEKLFDGLLATPFNLKHAVYRIGAKVGVSVFPEDGADAESLFMNAEAALKNAKASGNRFLLYTRAMTEKISGRLTLENQLRLALENGEFILHYQPKVDLSTGKLTSAEALIRWNDPRTGLVPPGQFIPILEDTGLILDVGRWALHQAIADHSRWKAEGLPAVRIAVNVSALQLRHRGFIAELRQAIGIEARVAAGLELEITESLIMTDVALHYCPVNS